MVERFPCSMKEQPMKSFKSCSISVKTDAQTVSAVETIASEMAKLTERLVMIILRGTKLT